MSWMVTFPVYTLCAGAGVLLKIFSVQMFVFEVEDKI